MSWLAEAMLMVRSPNLSNIILKLSRVAEIMLHHAFELVILLLDRVLAVILVYLEWQQLLT